MVNEKRLIDADDALEQLKQAEKEMKVVTPLGCKAVDIKVVLKYLESRPTVDAVEVVRCKDCKYCDPENLHCDHSMGTTFPFRRKPDDFCSYGERRNDAGT